MQNHSVTSNVELFSDDMILLRKQFLAILFAVFYKMKKLSKIKRVIHNEKSGNVKRFQVWIVKYITPFPGPYRITKIVYIKTCQKINWTVQIHNGVELSCLG